MEHQRVPYKQFSEEEQREIVFKDITTGEVTHTTILDTAGVADYRSVIGYFARTIMKELRLVSGYDVLYGKIKTFVQTELFDQTVDLEHPNTLRNTGRSSDGRECDLPCRPPGCRGGVGCRRCHR